MVIAETTVGNIGVAVTSAGDVMIKAGNSKIIAIRTSKNDRNCMINIVNNMVNFANLAKDSISSHIPKMRIPFKRLPMPKRNFIRFHDILFLNFYLISK